MHTLTSAANRILLLIRNLVIAALATAVGLVFGHAFTSPKWTWPLTLTGVTAYVLVILANPLAGMLLWIVTAPFSRFFYFDIILGRGVPDLTLTRVCAGLLVVVVLAQLAVGKMRVPRLTFLDAAVLATLIGVGASLPASYGGLRDAVTSWRRLRRARHYLLPGSLPGAQQTQRRNGRQRAHRSGCHPHHGCRS